MPISISALAQAIGVDEAETVQQSPTLAFRFAVGLRDPGSPEAHARMDGICQQFGGMVEHRHEGTTVPNYDVVMFTTVGGALALATELLVKGMQMQVKFVDPQHIHAIELGASGRSYGSGTKASTRIPFRASLEYGD